MDPVKWAGRSGTLCDGLGRCVSSFCSPWDDVDFDLVISDVYMPRLDGYALREALAAQGVPVLLISGAFAAGETTDPEVLAKPFNARTLCTRIRALLDPAATA